MFTRQQYLNNKCTHRQYYKQFVTKEIRQIVLNSIGLKTLLESKDEHLNDIPLKQWDLLAQTIAYYHLTNNKFKELNDYPTLAGLVCVLKESAKQIIETTKANIPLGIEFEEI